MLARLEGEVVTAEDVAGATFADLGLGEGITKALTGLGAVSPFPIQAATIPDALAGAQRARPRPHRQRQDHRLRCRARRAADAQLAASRAARAAVAGWAALRAR